MVLAVVPGQCGGWEVLTWEHESEQHGNMGMETQGITVWEFTVRNTRVQSMEHEFTV